MFIIHRLLVNLRRIIVIAYYKIIYGEKFAFGEKFRFRGNFKLYIEPTGSIKFGNHCFINNYFSATSIESVTIGDDCIFGENVKIYDGNHKHDINGAAFWKQGMTHRPVVIGHNCWIGSNVTILAGVHIGDNCVIGANCLIYKDVPSNSVIKCGGGIIQR